MVGGVAAGVEVWINAVGSGLLIPPRRVGEAQRVVAAVGIAVESVAHVAITEVGRVAPSSPGIIAQPFHVVAADRGHQVALVVFQGIVHGASSVVLGENKN